MNILGLSGLLQQGLFGAISLSVHGWVSALFECIGDRHIKVGGLSGFPLGLAFTV